MLAQAVAQAARPVAVDHPEPPRPTRRHDHGLFLGRARGFLDESGRRDLRGARGFGACGLELLLDAAPQLCLGALESREPLREHARALLGHALAVGLEALAFPAR